MDKQTEPRMIGNVDVGREGMELFSQMESYIHSHFDELVDTFLESFAQYAQKVAHLQAMGIKEEIAFLHFSALRTNILAKRHFLRIDAYNRHWYSDRVECQGEYDVSEIYQWLDRFASVLDAAEKNARGRATVADVQAFVFEESKKYLLYVSEIIRAGMKKAAKTESYQRMNRHEVFVVYVGGYQDQSQIVFKEDTTMKDAKVVKRHLEAKQQVAYVYEIGDRLDLSEGNYEDIKLMFSSFSGSDFSGSSFKKSAMVGNDFRNAIFRHTNFEQIQAFDLDFRGAVLENVSFRGAKLNRISFEGARLTNVRFEGALSMENMSFHQAELTDTIIPDKQEDR